MQDTHKKLTRWQSRFHNHYFPVWGFGAGTQHFSLGQHRTFMSELTTKLNIKQTVQIRNPQSVCHARVMWHASPQGAIDNNNVHLYYNVLINALWAHIKHTNMKTKLTIFYTHIKHSPTDTVYIKLKQKKIIKQVQTIYTDPYICTHTHSPHIYRHNCSVKCLLILAGMEVGKRQVFSFILKDGRVQICKQYN